MRIRARHPHFLRPRALPPGGRVTSGRPGVQDAESWAELGAERCYMVLPKKGDFHELLFLLFGFVVLFFFVFILFFIINNLFTGKCSMLRHKITLW